MNLDDRLSTDTFGQVKSGNGIIQDSHLADVCPQPTIPDPLHDLPQLGAIGFDHEADCQWR